MCRAGRTGARPWSIALYPHAIIRQPLTEITRAGEWWEHKLVPIFAAFYATALTLDASVFALRHAALLLFVALVPGAVYVSVLNDATDQRDDRAAGKPNRLAGRSPLIAASLLTVTIGLGAAIAFQWRDDAILLGVYLAAWLAFSLYSLPPFRFKTRGVAGVVCDAAGAHLFPTLVAVLVVFRASGRQADAAWVTAVGAWAFAHGLRGILWHQLADLENDRQASVRTFAVRHPAAAAFLGTWVAFPVELLALSAMFALMRSAWPLALLAAYGAIAALRLRWWRMNAVVVVPKPRFLIVLEEYYQVFLPLAILVATGDWIVIPIHLLFFPVGPWRTGRDVLKLARERNHPS